jgi:hypothetical protein
LVKSSEVASNFLGVVDDFSTFTPAQIARDKAFAEFLRGMSLGYLALFYDSAAVVTKGMDPLDKGALSDYKVVMDSALAAMQRAIDNTNTSAAGTRRLQHSWRVGSLSDGLELDGIHQDDSQLPGSLPRERRANAG